MRIEDPTKALSVCRMGKKYTTLNPHSPPRHNLKIHQPRCQPIRQEVGGV